MENKKQVEAALDDFERAIVQMQYKNGDAWKAACNLRLIAKEKILTAYAALAADTPPARNPLLTNWIRGWKAMAADPSRWSDEAMAQALSNCVDELETALGLLPGKLKGVQALADEKCRVFYERATQAEAKNDSLVAAAQELMDAAEDYRIHSEVWSGKGVNKSVRLIQAREAMRTVLKKEGITQ